MTQPTVFVTRQIPQPALERLRRHAAVEVWPDDEPPDRQTLIDQVAEVDGVLSMLTDPITADFFENTPRLKAISQMAVGFDNIAVDAATRKGIPVGHTPGILTETTADFAWALLMAAARRVVEAHNQVQRGVWQPWGPDVLTGYDVHGATLGIIGFGRIGQAMARRAQGFDMRVLYFDRDRYPLQEATLGVQYAPFDTLLTESDFVSLHVYLSPENRHMISRDQLKRMKQTAVLVNTARGAVVDNDALAEALLAGEIAAAGVDPEPIPVDHPLLGLPNAIVTPHIASASKNTRLHMAEMAVDNLIAGLEGRRMPNCANPEVYTACGPRMEIIN